MTSTFRITALSLAVLAAALGTSSAADTGDRDDTDSQSRIGLRSVTADILYGSPLPISTWQNSLTEAQTSAGGSRSIPLAFGMSAVVPGLGQAYNKDWIGMAIFVAAEAALIIGYASAKSSGNDGVEEYENYANLNWSPVRYAEWLNAYSGYSGPEIGLPSLSDEELMQPDEWSAAQRAEIDAFFNDIRQAERSSVYLSTGAAFSHVIPYFGEQQYYELIGKYFQYAPGWDDYTYDPDADPRDVMPEDAKFYTYAIDHAAANDDLRRAKTLGALVIINHFAAAIEAAVVARLHNKRIRPSMSLLQGPSGDIIAQARVSVKL